MQRQYKALLQWIHSAEGSFVGPIAPHLFADTGRGVIALQNLHAGMQHAFHAQYAPISLAGQQTLTIPERLLMHAGSAARSSVLQAAMQGLSLPDEQACIATK